MGLLPVAVGGALSHAWSPSPWLLLFQPAGFSLGFLTAALVLNWNQTLPYSLFCRSPNTCLPLAAPSLPHWGLNLLSVSSVPSGDLL